jgi:hypothetical protein
MADTFRLVDDEATAKLIWKELARRIDGCREPRCWILKDDEDGQIYLDKDKMEDGKGRYVQIRRLLFLTTYRTLPPGRKITMRCGESRCVNPAHAKAKGVPVEYELAREFMTARWITEEQAEKWYSKNGRKHKILSL